MLGTVRRPLRPGVSDSFPYPTRMSGGDVPIAYFDVGSGPVLLLIHGLGSNFTHFQLVAPGLARHYRVVGVDLPGCGDSAKPYMRYTIDGYIDACVRLLDELEIPQATWVGHSLGGMCERRGGAPLAEAGGAARADRGRRFHPVPAHGAPRLPRAPVVPHPAVHEAVCPQAPVLVLPRGEPPREVVHRAGRGATREPYAR